MTGMATTDGVSDLIGPALERAADKVAEAFLDAARAVQNAVDRHEQALRSAARHDALCTMLAAIGQEPPVHVDERAESAAALRTALGALLGHLGEPVRSTSAAESIAQLAPEPRRVDPPCGLPPSREDPPSKRTLRLAWDVLKEASELRNKLPGMHELRAEPAMQGVVADVRGVLALLPSKHPLFARLEDEIGALAAAKLEHGPPGFIRGLAFKDQFDDVEWEKISKACWAKVAKFDADVEYGERARAEAQARAERVSQPEKATLKPEPKIEAEPPPEWPFLRKLVAEKPILIVGNVKKAPQRAEWVRDKLGFSASEVQWAIIDNDKGAVRQIDNVVARIDGGGIGGVVLLEGFVEHKVTNRVGDAVVEVRIPMAFGGRGGNGELREAFSELNRQISCIANFGIPTLSTSLPVLRAQTQK